MSGPQLAAVIADSLEAKAMLWNALIALEGRLSEAEAQLKALQQDHDKLLLRQMASQAENKLARIAQPGLAPKSAVHMTFGRLSKGRDKGVDKVAFKKVVRKYPGLADGLESLKTLGTPIAHPEMDRVHDGSQQPITDALLRELINKEYTADDPVKPDVEEVLGCLTFLAKQLHENLFVPTM